jgi:hypothetical protein
MAKAAKKPEAKVDHKKDSAAKVLAKLKEIQSKLAVGDVPAANLLVAQAMEELES